MSECTRTAATRGGLLNDITARPAAKPEHGQVILSAPGKATGNVLVSSRPARVVGEEALVCLQDCVFRASRLI